MVADLREGEMEEDEHAVHQFQVATGKGIGRKSVNKK